MRISQSVTALPPRRRVKPVLLVEKLFSRRVGLAGVHVEDGAEGLPGPAGTENEVPLVSRPVSLLGPVELLPLQAMGGRLLLNALQSPGRCPARAASRSRVEARGHRVGEDLEPERTRAQEAPGEPVRLELRDIAEVGEGVLRLEPGP